MPTNDNAPTTDEPAPAGSHGRAALLLIESLIHGLCEDKALSVHRAVEIAERAADVQHDQAKAADRTAAEMWESHALLVAIVSSLSIDDHEMPPPRLVT